MESFCRKPIWDDIATISVSRAEHTFTFGVLSDGNRAGYNTASQLVGRETPVEMTVTFEVEDGRTFTRQIAVDLAAHPEQDLDFVVTQEFEVKLK